MVVYFVDSEPNAQRFCRAITSAHTWHPNPTVGVSSVSDRSPRGSASFSARESSGGLPAGGDARGDETGHAHE
jgi:hypothetical protein